MTSAGAYRGLGDIIVTARPYDEYLAMFGLAGDDPLQGPVLDCPAGASGFAAGARARGADVMAVDPGYAPPPDLLSRRAVADARYGQPARAREPAHVLLGLPPLPGRPPDVRVPGSPGVLRSSDPRVGGAGGGECTDATGLTPAVASPSIPV